MPVEVTTDADIVNGCDDISLVGVAQRDTFVGDRAVSRRPLQTASLIVFEDAAT